MPKPRALETTPLPFEVAASLEALGVRITRARKQRRYSQKVFADILGIAAATLVAIEHGASTVQIGHYARALWMLEIQDAVLGGFGFPPMQVVSAESGSAS